MGGNGGGETSCIGWLEVDIDDCIGLGGGSGGSPAMLTLPASFLDLSLDPDVGLGTADAKEDVDFKVCEIVAPLWGGLGGGDKFGMSSWKDESMVYCFPNLTSAFGNVFGLELDSEIVICFKI